MISFNLACRNVFPTKTKILSDLKLIHMATIQQGWVALDQHVETIGYLTLDQHVEAIGYLTLAQHMHVETIGYLPSAQHVVTTE